VKRILILTEHYPTDGNIYNYMFIHSRVIEYLKEGFLVKVLYLANDKKKYMFEGVEVYMGKLDDYLDEIHQFSPEVIFTHSPKKKIVNVIKKIKEEFNIKNYTWIHGVEAISIYRRIFNISSVSEFFKIFTIGLLQEIRRILRFRKYVILSKKWNDEFIFVSDWMRKVTVRDNFIKIDNYSIIPNFIDDESFHLENIESRNRLNLLIVRSFESRKYANDIAVKIVNKLNTMRSDFTLTIYGQGKHFDECVSKIVMPKERLSLHKKMLNREELKNCFNDKKYSFFICPTRQDAQGVTMCEAMSSGLLVVTNPSTAIPEFVKNDYAIIDNNIEKLAQLIDSNMNDERMYLNKINNAVAYIKENLSRDVLIKRELSLAVAESTK
jgi:glycosyltransferase involved in cell wall biosynthesis